MMIFLAFMNLGGQELILILLIVLVLFGSKKLPELARGMGQAMKEFQKAKEDLSSELHASAKTDVVATTPATATVPTTGRIENTAERVVSPSPAAAVEPGTTSAQV